MNSKQLNFFIVPNDYPKINEFIIKQEAIVLANQDISDNVKIIFRNKLPDNQIFQIYLSTKNYTDDIIISTTSKGKKYFNIQESCILEFSLGGFYPYDTNVLQRARFYYVNSFYDKNGNMIKKRNDFTLWCDNFIQEFKKQFLIKYDREKEFLYSEFAIKWIEENEAIETEGCLQWKK